MSDLYDKAEKFVIDSFTKAGHEHSIKHFERTVYWIKQLKPDADEALQISAVAHDIERAFREKKMWDMQKEKSGGYTDKEFLRAHEEKSASLIGDFLKENGASQEFIDRVKMLVSRHEEGGNEDQDLLKDADSVSFFENNIPLFLTEKLADVGKEKVRVKFDWMFNRISSDKAKEICKHWYEKALTDLESK